MAFDRTCPKAPRAAQGQGMAAQELGIDARHLALALFCKLHGLPERSASTHLELTPREHFDEGVAWASSNMPVVKMLRKSPDTILADDYKLSEARSWLARASSRRASPITSSHSGRRGSAPTSSAGRTW